MKGLIESMARHSTDLPDELFILAMDHRDSLERDVYGVHGKVRDDELRLISDGKRLVFAGLLKAIEDGVDRSVAGVLVDERYGAQVARDAESAGLDVAMPIEASGHEFFTLEYGTFDDSTWIEHIRQFDPDQIKVLVRDNPDGPAEDAAKRREQFENLATVSETLAELNGVFLFELVIPPTDEQLASVNNEHLRFDAEIRPDLTVRIITEMQAAGVEPNIWKIEGLETTSAAQAVVQAARQGGRDSVQCIVLGRDAPADRLDHWLSVAAATDGFIGFAIGRSIWEQALVDHLAGRKTETQLIQTVAENYRHFVDSYREASGG